MSTKATTSRERNARATANDAAIAAAAVSEILRVGVDRLSLREVARHAGLTHGAAYARYEDVSELLVELWHSQLSGSALELLQLSLRAAEDRSETSVRALFDRVREPRAEDVAMVEMLMVAHRKPVLYEELEVFIKKHMCSEDGLTKESRALFLRSISVFGLVTVCAFESYYLCDDRAYLDVVERALVTALRTPTVGSSLATRSDEAVGPDKDDENLRARLVYATYAVVAKTGYHEATVSRIARRADCSPGAIYKLYRSKQELVVDAFRTIFGVAKAPTAPVTAATGLDDLLSYTPATAGRIAQFAIETIIAGAHVEELHASVGSFLRDPERRATQLVDLDAPEGTKASNSIHAMAMLMHSIQWMSSVTSSDTLNFAEFSDSFRGALMVQ